MRRRNLNSCREPPPRPSKNFPRRAQTSKTRWRRRGLNLELPKLFVRNGGNSKQLATALEQVQAQQKAISSSQNFVKEIFSSYTTDIISVGNEPKSAYAIQPQGEKPFNINGKTSRLFTCCCIQRRSRERSSFNGVSLPNRRNSYFMVAHTSARHPLGRSTGRLRTNAFDISYFPDTGDKETIKSLTVRDGRVYADGRTAPETRPG